MEAWVDAWACSGVSPGMWLGERVGPTACMKAIVVTKHNVCMFLKKNWHFARIQPAQFAIQLIAIVCLLAACTPTFNWREVGFDGLPVTALLPCKPDRGTRQVPIAGQPRAMTMAGCESGGALFTVAVVNMDDTAQVAAAQAELQAANKATQSRYFNHGPVLVQASIYGSPKAGSDGPGALSAQVSETFFGGVQVMKR
jgi:hypothetical protein